MHVIEINDLKFEVNKLSTRKDTKEISIGFELTTKMDDITSIKLSQLCVNTKLQNKKVKVSIDGHEYKEEFFLDCHINENNEKNERYFDITLYTL